MFKGYLLLFNYTDKNIVTDYRGIFRAGAMFMNPISPTSEEWDIWLKQAKLSNDEGFLLDIELALFFLAQYQTIGIHYELVACFDVTDKYVNLNNHLPYKYEHEFLGYDICADEGRFYSFIFWWGYDRAHLFDNKPSRYFFAKKLNKYKLFNTRKFAKVLGNIELSLCKKHPEDNSLHANSYKIYKLFKIIV